MSTDDQPQLSFKQLLWKLGLSLLVIFAVLTVFSLPSLRTAIGRSKQAGTRSTLYRFSHALEEYEIDHGQYPAGVTTEQLTRMLRQYSYEQLSPTDAWNQPILYVPRNKGPTSLVTDGYTLIAPGRDGIFEHQNPEAYVSGPINHFDEDMVFRDGKFFRWPNGT